METPRSTATSFRDSVFTLRYFVSICIAYCSFNISNVIDEEETYTACRGRTPDRRRDAEILGLRPKRERVPGSFDHWWLIPSKRGCRLRERFV